MHPTTKALLDYFDYAHLPPYLAVISKPFADLAHVLASTLSGPETTVALRKLLESKDAAVRAAVTMAKNAPN